MREAEYVFSLLLDSLDNNQTMGKVAFAIAIRVECLSPMRSALQQRSPHFSHART